MENEKLRALLLGCGFVRVDGLYVRDRNGTSRFLKVKDGESKKSYDFYNAIFRVCTDQGEIWVAYGNGNKKCHTKRKALARKLKKEGYRNWYVLAFDFDFCSFNLSDIFQRLSDPDR